MAAEEDTVEFSDVLEPPKQVIKTYPPKYTLSSATKLLFSDKLSNILSVTKRKASVSVDDASTPEKRSRSESSSTPSPSSSPASASPSLCEARKLKIDLIAAKAQVTMLESRANHQRTKRKEMQILFEEEKGSLMEQHKSDERAISNMEDRLQLIRRREQELMNEYNQEKTEHKENKAMWDKEKGVLQKRLADMRDRMLECSVSGQDQMSEMKKEMDSLLLSLHGSQSEVEILKTEVAKQASRAKQCTTLKTKLEKQTFELQTVTNKLKELEYEKESYKDWQQQAKTAQNRLNNMAALETEVAQLRAQDRNLRECIVNKLLLEEQVHVLETRVDALRHLQDELHEAKVKATSLELSLQEWKAAASTHGIETANSLISTLDTVFNGHLDATTESSEAQMRLRQLSDELTTVKFERNKATGKMNELLSERQNQESLIKRLQKRQQLITHERDSYKLLLDSYEKELTGNLSGEQGSGGTELLKMRIEQQEQSLQRYRDLLISHDPTEQTKLVESLRAESSKRREEIEFLKSEVARLRAHRNTLHAQLESIGAQS